MYHSKITGLGFYVPENIVTNNDLKEFMETSDEWIQERTGIEERRWIDPKTGDNTSIMGVKAAKIAIERAGLTKDDIDFIVFATLSPDMYFPGGGVRVQDMLDMPTVGALDVRNQCSGFIYALSVADQFIKTGMYKNILVIGAENHSGGLEKSTRGRGVTVIFGDGAGAAVLSRSEKEGKGILSTHLHSEGKYARELMLEGPATGRWVPEILKENDPEDVSYFPYMNGQFVFKHAVVRFSEAIEEGLKENNLKKEDIDMLIPHQANLRISQFVQRKFRLPDEKVHNNIMKYGNTTAASVIIALTEAWEQGKIKDNDLVVLAAFGSGFTWGSVVIRW
ncbi:MAG: ketoacyl-ACP synthase III [Flavobacteriia bacterium]|nr:ketoacyl-ACP synthase III [Flavobacteriia bacterium]OIP48354.1 MAG: 3-oxoacyl-ACP synthase [Flavobacteriaceae bacterium CG2_30_31_66]PIV96301.1 MAG: 3-oxoacyl-ACP synthase [Flavobacteriaceae bacterium CG17_big_fil_post_rev_8_21_14_2_50_31_13]PIY13561.1 MAG: 3-oxoacyl-ACP synthase [Flavobacteriaceae bacterium CG_4_10_14_3_um_filter_31_253]PIZ09438.1 MAG: 3-oxoacyl-ACP synthase [Flavobacteriaceae bacterium CG_4_10_14_0_8_um_filter_31_99]PJC09956.1 MAG: 3-oxoacyl-ACP synthase [Flavobacteriacea